MSISIIRKVDIVAAVPDRWATQYKNYSYSVEGYRDKQIITDELQALKGTAFTAEQVNAIIGNTGWTENHCSECGKDHELLVRVGDEPDYEARYVDLCLSCAREAFEAIGKADVNTVRKNSEG